MNKKVIHSLIVVGVFLFSVYGRKVFESFIDVPIDSPITRLCYIYSWWVVPVLITVWALFGYKNIIWELRLNRRLLVALVFALVMVSPMLISSAKMGKTAPELIFLDVIQKTLLAGFMEEFLFRGFLFGLLFRKLGWGFIPASVLGAVIFASGHLYQAGSFPEGIGIFLVTFMGASWFAWLFIEWDENLWIPIFLHTLMNLSWVLFDVGGNALGDSQTNLYRAITIILSVATTIVRNIGKKNFQINRKNLLVNKG